MKPEKKITLFAVSVIILSCFFLLPANQEWMANRILPYGRDFLQQKSNLSAEHRKRLRYKGSYVYSRQIADFFRHKKQDSALVLIPSTAYFKARGIRYQVPEPAVFYYFTGLKTIWTNSRNAIKATWMVRMESGKFIFDSVISARQLEDSIRHFNQFPPEL